MIISKKQINILPFSTKLVLSICISLTLLSCDNTETSHKHEHHTDDTETSHKLEHQIQKTDHLVEYIELDKKSVSLTQKLSGVLEAVTRIRLYNDESGRIIKSPHHEGDFVKKGDLLIQLDNSFIKIDVAKAKASRQQAKVDLARLKKLLGKKISTEEEVAHAKTTLDLALAEENHQLTRLQRTTINAPIDGLITERLYEPGDLLAPQSHIQTIINPESLRLKASLAERWIPLVENKQAVTIRINALGEKTFTAMVNRIHPTINNRTHKGIIEILLSPIPQGSQEGQFIHAEIKLKATDRLVLPEYAVHFEPEGSYVYRLITADKKSSVEKVFFNQGQQFESSIEVLSQLNPGDRIISKGFLGLRDGKKVKIANKENNDNSTLTKISSEDK